MLHVKLHIEKVTDFNFSNRLYRYTSVVLHKITRLFFRELQNVISTYMTHTKKHGWNYNYTGNLARSFKLQNRKFIKTSEGLLGRATITSNHPGSRILETGGTVFPKTKKKLAVPLSSASAFGFSWETQMNLLSSNDLFRIGNILYVKIAGAKIPLFVLKPFVRIPAYKYITKTLRRVEVLAKQ